MAESITDLTRGNYQYDSDDGTTYTITMRNVYATASGLTAGSGGARFPRNGSPRHIWIAADNGSGHILRRKVPVSKSAMSTYEGSTGPGTVLNGIDGLNWTLHGFTGEKQKK